MNKDQLSGAGDRAVTVFITWLFTTAVNHGWVSASAAADYAPLALAVAVAVYGWWVNRPAAVVKAASNIPEVDTAKLKAAIDDPNLKQAVAK